MHSWHICAQVHSLHAITPCFGITASTMARDCCSLSRLARAVSCSLKDVQRATTIAHGAASTLPRWPNVPAHDEHVGHAHSLGGRMTKQYDHNDDNAMTATAVHGLRHDPIGINHNHRDIVVISNEETCFTQWTWQSKEQLNRASSTRRRHIVAAMMTSGRPHGTIESK